MTLVTFLSPTGQTLREVRVAPGQSVMRAALQENVEGIEAECGGALSCGTCHVYVEAAAAQLPPPEADETALLEYVAAERKDNSRLSCQLLGNPDLPSLTVRLPERQF